ncbi:hypothetical protein OAV26_02750 [Crocinitomicaceae bacterium]|nr:hypothetical protein [Crocinitomicaceae bacterium]
MKKIFLFIFLGLFLNSCNSYLGKKLSKKSADDIKVEKLKDECDCIEALDIIAADFLDVVGDNDKKSIRAMSDDKLEKLEKKVEPIYKKRDEVNEHCRKFGITYKRFTNGQECSSYKDLAKNTEQLKQRGFK